VTATSSDTPLWQPSEDRAAHANLTSFARRLSARIGRPLPDYASLHHASVTDLDAFWTEVWDTGRVIGDRGSRVVADAGRMPGARFFPDARLNFTENVLKRRGDGPAMIATTEAGGDRVISWTALRADVCRAARALRSSGVQAGDRVCGIVANVPEAIIAALGAAAIGAVWSSCSPDFGVQGILDRFSQIEPVVLLSVDGYRYGGKTHDCLGKLSEVVSRLPSVRRVVVIPLAASHDHPPAGPGAVPWHLWLEAESDAELAWERFAFNHPLYVLYSSGTTGIPKCIVHGTGGTLLQHLKEHQLHCDIKSGDRVFYFTTCGWMMWNWLVTVLASDAAIVLYDGSPFHPTPKTLFDLADRTGVTLFGTSAKFIDAVFKSGVVPRETNKLQSIRTITSTGSPLSPEGFDFVYRGIKSDVHLASISGGTDIVSCFVGGNPAGAVWRGEIQARGLGMDVDVFDAAGRPLADEPGELVCKKPFPSMPVGFWNDADGEKYRTAYFERFPGVWCHGDWMQFTPHGGAIIYGRSDATLKPGGVRIGTAEIYRQVEQLPEVLESLAIGQAWDGDERIVLFVRLAEGAALDPVLKRRISDRIKANASPRHVPARIIQVRDIPRTKSGKIVELAVRNIVHGRPVTNREALANPEALDLFRDLPELKS
jgi:acetoacetyl-CoA synthetase